MMSCKKMLLGISLLVGGYCQGSVYYNARDYTRSYLPMSGGSGVVLTADSPSVAQIIASSQTPATWAVNARKGVAGYINQLIGTAPDAINAMVVAPNGTFTVVGSSTSGLTTNSTMIRYGASGALDTSFNSMGYAFFDLASGANDSLTSVCFDASGQGYYVGANLVTAVRGAVAHVTSAGALDTSFGTAGLFTSGYFTVSGVALQSTGGIVYTGQNSGAGTFFVDRLTSAGIADASFTAYTNNATMSSAGIAVDSQGRIIVVGGLVGTLYVYRFLPNGGLDTTFNGTGWYSLATSQGRAVAVLPDDSIVVAGCNNTATLFKVVKLTSAGILDITFGAGTGIVTFPFGGLVTVTARAITLLPSGQIAVSGQSNGFFAIMLLNSDGSLDTTFTIPGQTTTPGTAVFQIGGVSSILYASGYQNIADSGLVVAGTTGVVAQVGAVFYTNAGVSS